MGRARNRRRGRFPYSRADEETMKPGDALGFHYPPLPAGGSRQVLGTMPTDPNIIPSIPDWLPFRHHRHWSNIWQTRSKQYRAPGSREVIPWDTTHDPMGDYQGYDEYYVKGCFGYDENGEEIRYRPGLPGVHIWQGRGLVLAPQIVRVRSPPPPPAPFLFFKSAARYKSDALRGVNTTETTLSGQVLESSPAYKHETTGFTGDDFGVAVSPNTLKHECFSRDSPSAGPFSLASFDGALESFASINVTTVVRSTRPADLVEENGAPSLLNLPGEIRNIIYSYLYEETNDYEIIWCARQKNLTHYKHKVLLDVKGHKSAWSRWAKHDPRLDIHFERPAQDTKAIASRRNQARQLYTGPNHAERITEHQAAGPAAFLLVCKKLYEEAMPLFYQKHSFSFCSRTIMHKFTTYLSTTAMSNISKIYITHDPQGWPMRTKDAVLVTKEYKHWIRDLKNLVEKCTNLSELTMLLTIRDPQINDAEQADWAMALRRGLAGLKHLPRFTHFDLVIRYGRDSSKVGSWAQMSAGDSLLRERTQDLEDLVCTVKGMIFGAEEE